MGKDGGNATDWLSSRETQTLLLCTDPHVREAKRLRFKKHLNAVLYHLVDVGLLDSDCTSAVRQ